MIKKMSDQPQYEFDHPKAGQFTSHLTDAECAAEMGKLLEAGWRSNFAQSLYNGFRQYGRFTDGQRPWAHKLVLERINGAKPKGQVIPGFKSIYDHMLACRQRREEGGKGLKQPKLYLDLFRVMLTGQQSKRPNHLAIALGGFGTDFYGYIDPEGNFEKYGKCTEEVLALLRRIAVDPERVISEVGKESGKCLYCGADLTQVQSKIAGCGKTCARNWAVWFPNAQETRAYLLDHPQVLTGSTDADRWS